MGSAVSSQGEITDLSASQESASAPPSVYGKIIVTQGSKLLPC